MDDSVRIKSGALGDREEMPKLKFAETINGRKYGSELGFRTDTEELYVGTPEGNKKIGDAGWEARIKSLETQIQDIMARLASE